MESQWNIQMYFHFVMQISDIMFLILKGIEYLILKHHQIVGFEFTSLKLKYEFI